MAYKQDVFSSEIRVDQNGNGHYTTVKAACDFAATLTLSADQQCMIKVNAGKFVEEPFTIPSWCVLDGVGDGGETGEPGTKIIRSSPLATDTAFITMENSSTMVHCAVDVLSLPANFTSNFALVRLQSAGSGGGLTGTSWVERCRVTSNTAPYNGANILSLIYIESGLIPLLLRSLLQGSGTSCIILDSESEGGTISFSSLLPGSAGAKHIIRTNNTNFSNTSRGMKVQFCRLHSGLIPPYTAVQLAHEGTVKVDDANARFYIFGTRLPFDERVGTGTFYDVQATPQQLEVGLRAASKTVSGLTYAIDSYADGTIRTSNVAGCTVTLPSVSTCITGQSFVVKHINAATTIIDASGGVLIDGAATASISVINDSLTFQLNDVNTWDII